MPVGSMYVLFGEMSIQVFCPFFFFFFLRWGFPSGSGGKVSTCQAGDLGSIPGLGISPGEGNGNPLQFSCMDNSMDRGAWIAIIYGVSKSQTWLKQLSMHAHPFFDWVTWFFFFFTLNCMRHLYILEISQSPVSHIICKYFLPFHKLSFHFIISFTKSFKFNWVPFVYFCFYFCYSRRQFEKNIAIIYVFM